MKKAIIIFNLILCYNLHANDSLFISANNDYANQDYINATAKYDSLIANNFESAELYYNLGNCFYKTNEIHQAIYYYEKSLKIDPNFEDAQENIKLCKLQLIDKIDQMPELFYKKYFKKIKKLISLNSWKILSLISIWTFFLFFILKIFFKKKTNFISPAILVLSLIFLLITISVKNDELNNRSAIIYASTIDVMSAPSGKSTKLFTLHLGTKININDQIEDWVNISIDNGKKGWILTQNLKEI
ncbi:MAG: tetratricopeptide repeat protein [Flavobacteriales bacterium]|nr:tetratricopeptide repeat protein [Flavobacteriales bacterium]